MLELPPPVIAEHHGFRVVRDDLLDGGTKVRAAVQLLDDYDEFVYAGPAQGYAQLALAIAAEACEKRATFFTAARKEPHPITREALAHGLKAVFVPAGRLSNVKAKARAYCEMTGAYLAPVGLLLPGMQAALADIARALPIDEPAEVWVASGSGTLCSALCDAWPGAAMNAVQVGMAPRLPAHVKLWQVPERFEEPAVGPLPPFPSAIHYDAKVWPLLIEHGSPGALFWNVAR